VNHDVTPDLNNHDAQPIADDTTPYFGEDDEEDNYDDNPSTTNTLIRNIISETILHGQTKDDEADKQADIFLKLLDQAKKELYLGCKNATKVSFIVELFPIKCIYGLRNTTLEAILKVFGKVLEGLTGDQR
jgi:hypothetical protein